MLATIWYVKGCSALPVVVSPEVIAGGMPARENVSVLTLPNPFELLALTPTTKVPETLGVPAITPVSALKLKPSGNVPELI